MIRDEKRGRKKRETMKEGDKKQWWAYVLIKEIKAWIQEFQKAVSGEQVVNGEDVRISSVISSFSPSLLPSSHRSPS